MKTWNKYFITLRGYCETTQREHCFITKEYHDSRDEKIILKCLALSQENL